MRRWALFGLIGLAALICALLAVGAGAQQGPLTLEERTASSLSVAWNWDERPAAAFEVAWRARGEAAAASWRSARKEPSERRHTISELDAGTHYIVRVRALDAAGLPLSDLRKVFATAESAPLTLALESSRDLCTAGTLTEVSWKISGGSAPYALSVENSAVDVSADNVRVNCGALTEAEAGDAEAALAAKTVSATVTDSRGVQRQAALDVARARALPALLSSPDSAGAVSAYRAELGFEWHAPSTLGGCRDANCFAIRWRAVGAEAWTYSPMTHAPDSRNLTFSFVRGLADGVVYEAAAAAMRDPIELETPEALQWTTPLSGTTLTNPTGLTATATHDTVTVRWNRQPTARFWSVSLGGPDGGVGEDVFKWDAASWGDSESSVHEVVFRHLPSSTRFKAVVAWDPIEGYPETRAETTVETLALPAGREPLKRGAQNLRATATHNSITAVWDQPFEESDDFYLAFLFRVDYPYRAARVTPVWHPNTQVTFAGLEPDTDYRVEVVHMAIVRPSVEISITTSAQPSSSSEDGAAGASAGQQSDADEWPLSGAFQPVWPHPLRMANGDVEGSRFDRWHGGIGTSLTPLHLELQSSRELCTAGTLTEISWTISGGVAPYELSVEGAAVDLDADNVRVNCGALTEAEAGDAEAALAAKTVSAVVTDSRGVQRQAALEVDRARALPAPSYVNTNVQQTLIALYWSVDDGVRGTDGTARYLVRSRLTGQSVWNYIHEERSDSRKSTAAGIRGLSEGAAYEAQVAAMRDPLEGLTPAALSWSATATATTAKAPTGVRATATHDTVTVVWDAQPSVDYYYIRLVERGSQEPGRYESIDASPTAIREVTFRGLDAATNYTVTVSVDGNVWSRLETDVDIATAQAPANWTPSERAPVIIRTHATHDTIEVSWAAPPAGARLFYLVSVEHPASPYVHAEWVDGGTAFSLDRLAPETTYTVHVHHHDLHGGTATVEITTLPSPPVREANEATRAADRGGSIAPFAEPRPLFEWWADGRPTSPPLDLKLRSSRELCTAGTLTEISWTISGGVAPYRLSIEGAAVNVDADNIRINCGALTEAEAGDAEAALAAKTVSAVVIDSRGVQRQAALEVARARALPAPQNISYAPELGIARTFWDWVEGAGSQSPEILAGGGNTQRDGYLVRYRAAGAGTWIYAEFRIPGRAGAWEIAGPSVHEMQVAAVRHSIEAETPAALRWSETLRYVYATAPENAAVTATATTVTVSWDAQPLAGAGSIILEGPRGVKVGRFVEPTEPGRHSYTFSDVPPETSYEVVIDKSTPTGRASGRVSMSVRTSAAPPGSAALPVGPQNVRAHATLESITVTWEAPHAGASDRYNVEVVEEATNALVDIYWINGPDRSVTLRSVFQRIRPATKYRVRVTHAGIVTSTVELVVTTPAAGQSTPLAQLKPRFEWWADGRPTSPPLHLELRSSRELCTAGTLTEVSWTISGGVAPYELTVEGAAVDVSTDNVRVNCGALTEAEAGDAEAALAAKTVSAVVTDSRGVQRQAALDVARARALPAPTPRAPTTVRPTSLHTDWVTIGGTHHDAPIGWWLIRWRPADADSGWNYNKIEQTRPGDVVFGRFGGLSEGSSYTFAVAALRDPIEQLTPNALTWSSELEARTTTTPTGVGATATHDTVTVTWDDQPEANVYVKIIRADGAGREEWIHVRPAADPSDEATFINLEPEAEYDITVAVDDAREGRLSTAAKVTTAAAPTGWQAPPRGAQNLSVTATHDTITVTWDAPVPNTRDRWIVYVGHPSWPRPYSHWVSAPLTFTLEGLSPATTYTVSVVHLDLYGVEVSTTVTTADAPRHGHYDQPPLIEWWADGRPASPPLDLKLKSSRELCTAGTLTEVSWEISGGVAPYELSIEGEAVDVDADNVRVNCGALTEAEVGDAEAALAAKRITATVTDSRGVQRQAALDVARARALPAPTNVRYYAYVVDVGVHWDEVNGAGSQSPTTVDPDTQNRLTVTGVIRTRANRDGAAWTYHTVDRPHPEWTLDPPADLRVLSVAAVRHPLELETSAALNWSEELVYTATKLAQNVMLVATHDTVTVSWDRQPYAAGQGVWVWLFAANEVHSGRSGYRHAQLREEQGVSGRHEVTFAHLPSDTAFAVVIEMNYAAAVWDSPPTTSVHQVQTRPSPAGWTAPPSGPQNLRYASTNDTLTVYWDEPYTAAGTFWKITIANPATGTTYRTESYGPSWTWPRYVGRRPNTEYRITIEHTDFGRGIAEITVRTSPALPAGQAESLAPAASPKPLFEWWADGRPTSPPLHLDLHSSRELCTAGTLTEISWQIGGGVAPYTLSIEGAAVDVDADNIRINCGALTEAEAGDAEAALAAKQVSAVVTDSRGVQRRAALDVDRARALPAPQNVGYWSSVSGVVLRWGRVAGAGSQSPLTIHPVSKNRLQVSGLVRTRANSDGAAWSYHTVEKLGHSELFVEPPPHLRVFSAAVVRHPLELETPGALNWSDEVVYAATKPAQNVTLAATHDTVTVSWDRQPYAVGQQILVWLFNDAAGNESWQYEHLSEEPDVTGRHTVTFTNLPPNTRLRLMIVMGDEIATRHYVRTRAAPSGWTPLPAGPRNLRHELDGDILTVLWDNPYAGAQQNWLLTIENPATGNSWLTDVYGTSWTLPGWLGVFPNTQYRVTVEHRSGMPPGSSSILITTPGPPTGQQIEVLDVSPRELWLRAFSRPGRR